METLAQIQQALKAPKGQTNAFGKYKYRSCEDILEAVKPHLGEWSLTLSDEIVLIGERYYVKSTALLKKPGSAMETGNFHHATAYARESLDKRGMDSAQITGAASSYSRKYCLNGLFAIDDTKDADATNDHNHKSSKVASKPQKPLPPADNMGLIQVELKRLTDDFQDTQSLIDIYKALGVENYNQIQNNTTESHIMVLKQLKGMK